MSTKDIDPPVIEHRIMSRRARHKEKRDYVVRWLLEFQYSTRSILCAAMQLTLTSQSKFFRSLKNSGLFVITRHPLLHEELLLLSYSGKQYAAMIDPVRADRYHATATRVMSSTTIHGLKVQAGVIARADVSIPFSFQSERLMEGIERSKRPDALIDLDGARVALEIELTQKSTKRIYLGFLDHVENMKKSAYERVCYLFPSQALKSIYQERFDRPQWPVFYRDRYGKVRARMDGEASVMARADGGDVRQRYSFEVEEAICDRQR